MDETSLAHSAPRAGGSPQPYAEHVHHVLEGARLRAEAMAAYCSDRDLAQQCVKSVVAAAVFHDLGKLDNVTQAALRCGRSAPLKWDHIDAGVAYLMSEHSENAAWLVRAHHAPGFPKWAVHFGNGRNSRYLRGRRRDDFAPEKHRCQRERTDGSLQRLLERHVGACGAFNHDPEMMPLHGLPLRFSLSCLIDADHADAAAFDRGWRPPDPAQPRWTERLASLDAYVAQLRDRGGERDALRREFYELCRYRSPIDDSLMACEGPVGIGKTTAVTAWLLRRAIATGARRLVIVAPYTNILSQTAQRLREALVLPDEQNTAHLVLAEHHHRADFSEIGARDLATLWNAPIVLTTAVQFFESLASNHPSRLRKLHALPGSVIFLDEAHAALPVSLWPQNWRWMIGLTSTWECSAVLASGSLSRFWEEEDIVDIEHTRVLSVLGDEMQSARQRTVESRRVAIRSLGKLADPHTLMHAVAAKPGPRLLIMNTIQSAAVMAKLMREHGHDVMHLSSALSPRDRAAILKKVQERLQCLDDADWTLVATSLVEAGVELSFRTAFRERFSTASLLQVTGRVNRHNEYEDWCTVYDFEVAHVGGLSRNPEAEHPSRALRELLQEGCLAGEFDAASLVTEALRRELWVGGKIIGGDGSELVKRENAKDYPEVARLGQVIEADTRLVVVDAALRQRLESGERVSSRDLLEGTVQIWSSKIERFGLEPIAGRPEVFWWPWKYDAEFLGYMAGVLDPTFPVENAQVL